MSYSKLHYDSVTFSAGDTSIVAAPHFICPSCKMAYERVQQVAVMPNRDVNFNAFIAFLCPYCNTRIDLCVAIHKTANLNDARVCIQRGDLAQIQSNWWTA